MYGGDPPELGARSSVESRRSPSSRRFTSESATALAASFLLLWGEAGVGKTRLLDEFAARAAAHGARVGIGEVLRRPLSAIRTVARGLLRACRCPRHSRAAPNSRPAEQLRPSDIGTFLPPPRRCASMPVPNLLLLDDLHWADFATLEFLAFFARRLEDAPCWCSPPSVPNELEVDHLRLEALEQDLLRNGARRLNVEPLGDDAMRLLVSTLWPARLPHARRSSASAPSPKASPISPRSSSAARSARARRRARSGAFEHSRGRARAIRALLEAKIGPYLLRASVIGRNIRSGAARPTRRSRTGTAFVAALCAARELQLVREIEGSELFRFATRSRAKSSIANCCKRSGKRLIAKWPRSWSAPICRPMRARSLITGVPRANARARRWRRASRRPRDSAQRPSRRQGAYGRAVRLRDEPGADVAALCEKFSRALSIGGNLAEACSSSSDPSTHTLRRRPERPRCLRHGWPAVTSSTRVRRSGEAMRARLRSATSAARSPSTRA